MGLAVGELSAEGGGGGGGLYAGQGKGKLDDRLHKTERQYLLEKMKQSIIFFCLYTHQRKFVPEIIPLWHKISIFSENF